MTLSRVIALLACVLLAVGAVVLSTGGKIKGLFETADSEVDNVTFEEPSGVKELSPPTRPTSPGRGQSPSGYLSNAYLGGSGSLDHMAELIDEGISLDGKKLILGALTASYHQPVAVPTNQGLVAFANPEHRLIAEAGGTTHVQIGVQAASRELPERPPVQLMLVLDTSGSMSPHFEQAKEAAVGMVDKLAPTDSFGLITYSDKATLVHDLAPVGHGGSARKAIWEARVGGGTNISAALEHAYAGLGALRDPQAISRVVLLSDGTPTAGITAQDHIRNQAWAAFQDGLQTTTLGFGVSFNSELMMGIAQEGKGNFHFVRDGAALAKVLDEELDQLTHVVAQAVRLRIVLPDDIELVRVLGADVLSDEDAAKTRAEEKTLDARAAAELGITQDRNEESDEGLKLIIPALHLNKHHVVMLEVAVPAGTQARDIVSVEVKYKDLLSKTNRTETTAARIERTASQADAVRSLDPGVKKNLLGFQTGEAMVRAAAHVEAGWVTQAVAVIDDQMALLGVASERWRDSEIGEDVELLGRYKDVLSAHSRGALSRDARGFMSKALAYNGYKLTR